MAGGLAERLRGQTRERGMNVEAPTVVEVRLGGYGGRDLRAAHGEILYFLGALFPYLNETS